jgi:hypothetical protein
MTAGMTWDRSLLLQFFFEVTNVRWSTALVY